MQRKDIRFGRLNYAVPIVTFLFTTVLSLKCHAQTKHFKFDEIESNSFKNYLLSKKVIAIADLHGTKESPEIFLQFVKLYKEEKKNVTVVLEINNNFQIDINQYLQDGDLEKLRKIEFFRYPDGRTSIAMVELLKQLGQMKGISVLCYDYDPNAGSESQRDSLMAVNLSNSLGNKPMIILTGNMHSSLKEGCCNIPGFKSALYRFKKMKNLGEDLVSFNATASGGSFWGCMSEGCKEWEVGGRKEVPNGLDGKDFISIYDKEDNIGFNGVIHFNNVSPSYPIEKKD